MYSVTGKVYACNKPRIGTEQWLHISSLLIGLCHDRVWYYQRRSNQSNWSKPCLFSSKQICFNFRNSIAERLCNAGFLSKRDANISDFKRHVTLLKVLIVTTFLLQQFRMKLDRFAIYFFLKFFSSYTGLVC